MTETWMFLIREPDWDSDRYLPENLPADFRPDLDAEMAAHGRFAQAVEELGGKIVSSYALQNHKHGGTVRPGKDGAEDVWSDASLADSSEVITGFYAVECDEAVARKLAVQVPTGGVVEMRKVHPFE
ncbi:YciI family protein [Nocardioides coralli]|uniref:YciI family protein n=1 Tax=Nocardioides coralli TaxID=2872154 RepID=UPI001CA3D9FB|nr:hypothetical protein [Nocardioides coralli]QZY28069.1 hypothetical protein K6T13_11255 [Nocardioides coralli]